MPISLTSNFKALLLLFSLFSATTNNQTKVKDFDVLTQMRPSSHAGDIYDVVAAASKFSSGEMTPSSNIRVPFTAAQRQELERQTIIYKYMMASVPVPPHLLIPISTAHSSSLSQVVKGSLELGISSSDPEPWRCKRTDGKKWRCSRDTAPDQKYCERHSHKSRPRSRKPVELHTEYSMAAAANANAHAVNKKSHFPSQSNSHFSMFPSAMLSAANSFDQPRSLEWFLKGETVSSVPSNSNQEDWHFLKQDRVKGHYREGQFDSNLRANNNTPHSLQARRLNDNCSLLLSPKSAAFNATAHTRAQETRHFLDAWSSAMNENSCASPGAGIRNDQTSSEKIFPLSTLTLSMSAGNDEIENGQASSGFEITGSDKDGVGVMRPQQWMVNHGSWNSSPPGGPLAEALCLGISNSARTDSYSSDISNNG